jgi:hypothetical protein
MTRRGIEAFILGALWACAVFGAIGLVMSLTACGPVRPCTHRAQAVTMATCAAAVSALTIRCDRGDKGACERRSVVVAGCDAVFAATEVACSR